LAGLFLEGHPPEQVLEAPLEGQGRILVGSGRFRGGGREQGGQQQQKKKLRVES
jgi:hypothetical protein